MYKGAWVLGNNQKREYTMSAKTKVGLVGCGAIGSELARVLEKDFNRQVIVSALHDKIEEKAMSLAREVSAQPRVLSLERVLEESDFIIEAASVAIAAEIVEKAVLAHKDILVMSVGGLLEEAPRLFALAQERGVRVYIPSGALCGIDGVKAASLGEIYKVTLTIRKPPHALAGAPYIEKHKIDLTQFLKETVIFEGTAFEAVKAFPQNVNVSAVLSLAGIGPEKTRVRIMTSVQFHANSHQIQLDGEFGSLTTWTKNFPSPKNPKTSWLAVLSAISTMKSIFGMVKIGT
jgi:aspartate dehydrogenase